MIPRRAGRVALGVGEGNLRGEPGWVPKAGASHALCAARVSCSIAWRAASAALLATEISSIRSDEIAHRAVTGERLLPRAQ